jgi:hypothetical protein
LSRIRTLLVLIGICLLSLLIACGGGDETDAESSAGSTGSASESGGAPAGSGGSASGGVAGGSSGAASASDGGATAVPACSLLTREEARAALGEEVGPPSESGEPPREVEPGVTLAVSMCRYAATGRGWSVSIGYERLSGSGIGPMRQPIRQQFEQSCARGEKISGVGDVACWGDSTKHTRLQFLKGTTSVIVSIFQQINDPDRAEALKIVAERAASRLP